MTTDERVLAAVEAMISSPSEINEITDAGDEYYFRFRGKVFSSKKAAGGIYSLYLYPHWDGNISDLAGSFDTFGDTPQFVTFQGTDFLMIGPDLFKQLYQLLEYRVHGVDKILDEILLNAHDAP